MKKIRIIAVIVAVAICSFTLSTEEKAYRKNYNSKVNDLNRQLLRLTELVSGTDIATESGKASIYKEISHARLALKSSDFWLRYFEPVAYNRINGPIPVEWENEVFEKFEKPYRRDGAGLTLAALYLESDAPAKDSLLSLINTSLTAIKTFQADSITRQLDTFDHFYLANRLFLLNLAAIYTTGFDCPEKHNIIPELRSMMKGVKDIYEAYNQTFPATKITNDYLGMYDDAIAFVNAQPDDNTLFDHFTFVRNHVNPLFAINQKLINDYHVVSRNYNDYTLTNTAYSIFDKGLYAPQNVKGIYSLVEDSKTLDEIKHIGKLLFYDPIISGNNQRSCASCHKPTQYFTDTIASVSMQFDHSSMLPRNTPTLINSIYNHLLMLDGKHISLQAQGRDVTTNATEMGSVDKNIVEKVMNCKEYKKAFKKFLKKTPEENKVVLDHIVSAITYYYSDFSSYYSPFDDAITNSAALSSDAVKGFNLFMGKAQCATCHFVPQFNGVKPPYITSEFEVIGVPADSEFTKLSEDKGRYLVHPADETIHAFRTGSIRNAQFTKPYMHNGVFRTLEEVIDFYNAGGGAGRHLQVPNQTLSADSLNLSPTEKKELISFIHSLNEQIVFQRPPESLPLSKDKKLNSRKVGGEY